jgi:hypothetical protein
MGRNSTALEESPVVRDVSVGMYEQLIKAKALLFFE